jgi:hypothetical protein
VKLLDGLEKQLEESPTRADELLDAGHGGGGTHRFLMNL